MRRMEGASELGSAQATRDLADGGDRPSSSRTGLVPSRRRHDLARAYRRVDGGRREAPGAAQRMNLGFSFRGGRWDAALGKMKEKIRRFLPRKFRPEHDRDGVDVRSSIRRLVGLWACHLIGCVLDGRTSDETLNAGECALLCRWGSLGARCARRFHPLSFAPLILPGASAVGVLATQVLGKE